MHALIDFILHIDVHLAAIIARYGAMTYAVLFAIVFVETGVVVMPFLPGDSLLFAGGAFAASGALGLAPLMATAFAAAFLGDAVNYAIGRRLGASVLEKGSLFGLPVKRAYLDRTGAFFARHGNKAIVFARFMPIVRTFAPFVAGIGGMEYRRFAAYNAFGGALWVSAFVLGGFFFGNIPSVRANFTHVIVAIILLSLVPPAIEYLHARREAKAHRESVERQRH